MKKIVLIAVIAINSSFIISSCGNSSSANVSAAKRDSSMIYSCTMHQEVISDHAGECPKCGMTLVKQKVTEVQKKLMEDGNYVKLKD